MDCVPNLHAGVWLVASRACMAGPACSDQSGRLLMQPAHSITARRHACRLRHSELISWLIEQCGNSRHWLQALDVLAGLPAHFQLVV